MACNRLVVFLLALSAAIGGARAEPWPTKPIRVIVPVAPGTGVDTISRLIFHQLSLQLGQQIVVENRGGAGGTIGVAAVAKADPDGYTLLGHSSSHTIAPAIYPSLPYDTARDFAAVAAFGKMPTALVLAPAKGFRTVQELVTAARAKPGSFTYASAGVGSTTHLTAERFRLSAGFEAIHVPYRGGGFRPEVASGRVDFAFSPIAVALPDIREGRLMALAVSSRERASALPDVPTTVEAGYPEFRLYAMGRRAGAGEDAARDHRSVAPGDHDGAADAGAAREARRVRRGADGDEPGRIRRVHPRRHSRQRGARQGRGIEGELNETNTASGGELPEAAS